MDPADQPDQPDPRADDSHHSQPVLRPGQVPLSAPSLFGFAQFELPGRLGPVDGRYLIREPGAPDGARPTHVLVLATLGAPRRHRLARRRAPAPPEPEPAPVVVTRATVIEVREPLGSAEAAREWLARAGEETLERALAVLDQALRAHRLALADPYAAPVRREAAIVSRVGFGPGEEVAEGRWSEARRLEAPARRQRRSKVLEPQARMAALLAARQAPLVGEELALRARLDVDHGQLRAGALQVMIALDALLAELPVDGAAAALRERLTELEGYRDPVAEAAQAALAGELDGAAAAVVQEALERIEALLRARAVAGG